MDGFVRLNLPEFEFQTRVVNNKLEIFDVVRRKYVILTPEEWVRQNFIRFLIDYKKYTRSLTKVEGGLKYNRLVKRQDILVLNQLGLPYMLIECKSADISISQKTFDQASLYNKVIKAKYLVVTNGLQHYCCEQNFENGTSVFLNEIPDFGT